jgi:hypothetical protein
VAVSGVKSPGDLRILLPGDMDDFTVRTAVDIDVIQILETVQSSIPVPIPQISPGDKVESGIASIDPSGATLSNEFPCLEDSPND